MFDLSKLEVADTAVMHVNGPDGEKLYTGTGENKRPVTITFHSPGSAAYVAASNERTNRGIRRSKKKQDLDAADLRQDQVDFLTAVTVSSDGLVYPPAGDRQGEELHRFIYGAYKIGFIADQATAFLNDWGNFTPASATN